jgi:hypothetical protein
MEFMLELIKKGKAFPLRGRWRGAPDEVAYLGKRYIYTSSVRH